MIRGGNDIMAKAGDWGRGDVRGKGVQGSESGSASAGNSWGLSRVYREAGEGCCEEVGVTRLGRRFFKFFMGKRVPRLGDGCEEVGVQS